MEVVEELCSFEGRLAGTDAERRAANRMAERLRESGRRAEVEPTYVHPQFALVHAAHCLLGIAGTWSPSPSPRWGSGWCWRPPRRCTWTSTTASTSCAASSSAAHRRTSSRAASGRRCPARVIVTAHLDAARTGAAFAPKRARASARFGQGHAWFGPFRFLFWSLALLLPALGAAHGGDRLRDRRGRSSCPPPCVLLVGVFALVDIQLSDVVPGANDNASGVAAAIARSTDLDDDPPENLDVWIVLPGAEECLQEGMRAFIALPPQVPRRQADLLRATSTRSAMARFASTAPAAGR